MIGAILKGQGGFADKTDVVEPDHPHRVVQIIPAFEADRGKAKPAGGHATILDTQGLIGLSAHGIPTARKEQEIAGRGIDINAKQAADLTACRKSKRLGRAKAAINAAIGNRIATRPHITKPDKGRDLGQRIEPLCRVKGDIPSVHLTHDRRGQEGIVTLAVAILIERAGKSQTRADCHIVADQPFK